MSEGNQNFFEDLKELSQDLLSKSNAFIVIRTLQRSCGFMDFKMI